VTQEDDHCETPYEAYQDIEPLLSQLTLKLKKSKEQLKIYDPYFCQGSVMENLKKLGFTDVYNKKEDFYQVIETKKLPLFDVIVTNPPYSADHIERILNFCIQSGKPWFLLVPNYVYMKPFYTSMTKTANIIYLTPSKRYHYQNPLSSETSPFISFWYISLLHNTKALTSWWNQKKKLTSSCTLALTTQQLPPRMRDGFDPNRKKLRKKQRTARKKSSRKGKSLCLA